MKIEVRLTYDEPQLRRLDIVIDGKPWYQEFMNVASGVSKNLPIGEHYLSINIDPAPPTESPKSW